MRDQDQPSVPGDEGATLLDVLEAYSEAGFNTSFSVTEDAQLQCGSCQAVCAPAEVQMDSMRRLEGASDPADMLAVVALTCPKCGAQGTASLGFGPVASGEDSDVFGALRDRRGDHDLPGHSAPGEMTAD